MTISAIQKIESNCFVVEWGPLVFNMYFMCKSLKQGMTFLVFSVEKKSKATNTNEKQSNQRCLNVIYMYILVCLWFIYSLFIGKILVNIKGILYTLKAV